MATLIIILTQFIMEAVIYPISDWFILAFFYLGLWFSKILLEFVRSLEMLLPAFLLMKCFQILFSDKRKKYHWTKLQQSPSKYFDQLGKDQDVKIFLKCFLFIGGLVLYTFVMLKAFMILTPPEEGIHFLDMFKKNWVKVFELFSTVTVLVAGLKLSNYMLYGIINSYKEFNLKMIFWM